MEIDLQTILYVIAGIIYLIYSGGKGLKKYREEHQSKEIRREETQKPKRNWQNELEEALKEVMQQPVEKTIPQERPRPRTVYQPIQQIPDYDDSVHSDTEMSAKEYEKRRKEELRLLQQQEAFSIEFAPTDRSRQSALHAPPKDTEEPYAAKLFREEGFDARKAFIYSEVFRRKYGEES